MRTLLLTPHVLASQRIKHRGRWIDASSITGKTDDRLLTEQNWQAYTHYLECRAVGDFPDDPIVRRHARLIRQIEDAADRQALLRAGLAKGGLT